MEIEAVGRVLAEARQAGRKLERYPGAQPSMEEALAMQEAMAVAMGVPVAGWKVGLTSARAQALCGVNAPLAGPVFADCIWQDGAEIAMVAGDLGILEAEIGFRMARDLPPRQAPYGRDEVLAAAGEVLPVIEWVNKRLPGDLREAPEWLVADGVINRGLVVGQAMRFEPARDLKAETVQVWADGTMVTEGVGANALGDPAEVLVWLANDLSARGKGLRRGDVIATGLICDVVQAEPGKRVEARFGALGQVALEILA